MTVVPLVQKEATPQEMEGQVIFISTYLAFDTDSDDIVRNTNKFQGKVVFCKISISEVPYFLIGCKFNWFSNK